MILRAGQILSITGSNRDSVRLSGPKTPTTTITFNSAEPDTKTLGPYPADFDIQVDLLAGNPTVAAGPALSARLQTIKSHTIIANAIIEGKRAMALADKMKTLATRAHAVPKRLEERADALAARLDAVEAAGNDVFKGHETFLAGVESGVAAAEDALNQLTNGAPVE